MDRGLNWTVGLTATAVAAGATGFAFPVRAGRWGHILPAQVTTVRLRSGDISGVCGVRASGLDQSPRSAAIGSTRAACRAGA
jgi:hypothetical protein